MMHMDEHLCIRDGVEDRQRGAPFKQMDERRRIWSSTTQCSTKAHLVLNRAPNSRQLLPNPAFASQDLIAQKEAAKYRTHKNVFVDQLFARQVLGSIVMSLHL